MNGDHPDFLEAARLATKFFPEAKRFLTSETGICWDAFLGAMITAEYAADYSCYAFRNPTDPDLGLHRIGGLEGPDDIVYLRLLSHAGLYPSGRAVVVPDAIGVRSQSKEECLPFVCDAKRVPERLRELRCFRMSRDTICVFESGEALLVDHDERVHWARSRINRR